MTRTYLTKIFRRFSGVFWPSFNANLKVHIDNRDSTPAWLKKKLVEPDALEQKIEALREHKLTIATLNGSFDLLHAGHLYIIHEASRQADRLIVALNSDSSIQQYKGKDRPIVPLRYRCEMMAALEFVDFVTWFDEIDSRVILKKIKPDVHVNGVEYENSCVEADTVRENGGRVHFVQRIESLSTSNIIDRIRCV